MDKRKILIRTGVIVFAIVIVIVCGILSVKSNGLFAESKDGLWKAYFVKAPISSSKGYQGYLFYYGNHEGNVGEIKVECQADKGAIKSRLHPGSHDLGPVESLLVGDADREGYLFREVKFERLKGASLGIAWKDRGEARYSSLTF